MEQNQQEITFQPNSLLDICTNFVSCKLTDSPEEIPFEPDHFEYLPENILFDIFNDINSQKKLSDEAINLLTKNNSELEALTIKYGTVTDRGLMTLAENCSLKHLAIRGVHNNITALGVGAFLEKVELETLIISSNREWEVQHLATMFNSSSKTQQITSLALRGLRGLWVGIEPGALSIVAENFSSLKSLDMRWTRAIADFEGLEKVLKSNPELSSLNAGYISQFTDDMLLLVSRSLTSNLISIDVEACYKISDNAVSELVTDCPNIETLRLKSCCMVFDNSLQKISLLKNLKFLNIAGLTQISDEGLRFLIKNAKNLEKLDVSGIPYVTPDLSVKEFTEDLPNLKVLDITGTKITINQDLNENEKSILYTPTVDPQTNSFTVSV